jgi:hypothetical protein
MKYWFLESSRKYIRTFEVSGSEVCVTEDTSILRCFALSNIAKFPKFLRLVVVLVYSVSKHPKRMSSLLVTKATVNLTAVNFTFMLPRIVIDFFLSNQTDALIIPILFCYKTLLISGIFSAHHQEFSTVHSAVVPSWLCLKAIIKNMYETYQCRMYSRKLLMMGKEDARNM